MARFRAPEAFVATEASSLLPFNLERTGTGQYLVANMVGDFIRLTEDELHRIIELRVQPGFIPAAESIVGIGVPAREFPLQIRRFIGRFRLGDFDERKILDEEMRREQADAAQAAIGEGAGVDGGDRCAVGMADEQPFAKADGVEQFRQGLFRFALHVVQRPGQGRRARLAVTGARIGEDSEPRGLSQPFGKIEPQAGAAKTLVQKNDVSSVSRRLVKLHSGQSVNLASPYKHSHTRVFCF